MSCNLKKDASLLFDARTTSGLNTVVFIKSDASPIVKVTAATFNGTEVTVDAAGKITLPASKKGTNVLNLTIEGAQAGDDIQLMEDCGDGKSSFLKKKRAGPAPGGADPVMGFRIHASSV